MPDQPIARIPFRTWQEFARFLTQKGQAEGLFIRTPKPPPVGTELGLQFKFPDQRELDLNARVVQVQHAPAETPGMTVQFTSMSAEQAELIQYAIKQASAAPREQPPQAAATPAGAAAPAVPASPTVAVPAASRVAGGAAAEPYGAGRFVEVQRFADDSKYDKAEERLRQMLAENGEDKGARIWQLIIQARRFRSQFSFDEAMERYEAVLMLDGSHREARRELETLGGEAERSKSLMERVFGSG